MKHALSTGLLLLMMTPAFAMKKAPVVPIKAAPIVPAGAGLAPLSPVSLTPMGLALANVPTLPAPKAPSYTTTALGPAMALSPKALAAAPRLISIEEVASGQPLLPAAELPAQFPALPIEIPLVETDIDLPASRPSRVDGILALIRKALGVTLEPMSPPAAALDRSFDGRK